jgi:hypothetical protein
LIAQIKRDLYAITDFEFENARYRFICSQHNAGVVRPPHHSPVRLTGLERTVID